MTEVNKGGRPPIFSTTEELENKVNEYFNIETCPDKRMVILKSFEEGEKGEYVDHVPHYTITGLAMHLGFESRQSIYDYIKRSDEFSYIIKRACLRVENNYEVMLTEKGIGAGMIFALKNMKWVDKQEIEQKVTEVPLIQDDV